MWQDQDDKENDIYYSPLESNVSSSAFIQIGSGRRAQSFRGETRKASASRNDDVFMRKGSLKDFGSRKTHDKPVHSRMPEGRSRPEGRAHVRSSDSFLSNDSFGINESGGMNESFGTNESIGSEGSDRFVTPPVSPLKPTQVTVISQSKSSPTLTQVSPQYGGYDDEEVDDMWKDNPLYSRGKYRKPTRRRQRDQKRHTTDNVAGTSVDTTPLDDILQDFEASARALEGKMKPSNANFKSGANLGQLSSGISGSRATDVCDKTNVSHIKYTMPQHSVTKDLKSETNGAFSPTKEEMVSNVPSESSEFVMLDGSSSTSDAIIDCISKEAPDDTLIKPSKLRASMRSRKERSSLRGGSFRQESSASFRDGQSHSSSDLSKAAPRGSLSPDMGRFTGSRDNLTGQKWGSADTSNRPKSFVQNGEEFIFKSTISPSARSNSVPEHKFKFTSTEINNNLNNSSVLEKASKPDVASGPIRRQGSFRSSANLILANSPSPRSAHSSTNADDNSTSTAHNPKTASKFSFQAPGQPATSPSHPKNLNLRDSSDFSNETQPVIMGQDSRSREASRKLKAFSPEEEYSVS